MCITGAGLIVGCDVVIEVVEVIEVVVVVVLAW